MYSRIEDKTVWQFALSCILLLLTPSLDFAFDLSVTPQNVPLGYTMRTVVIDPGHGGKDPGCHGNHTVEKHIALAISLELGELIEEAYPDIQVIYTRKTDVFIPLHERAKIANKAHADLFISVHCNYVGQRNRALGTETYVMGLHRAKDNLSVAKRENATILLEDDYVEHYDGYDPESDEGHIILSMYQNAFLEQSILLADLIEKKFVHEVRRNSRGVKQAGFLVLRNTTMPSVLVETGFLSHDEEEAFLSDANNQKEVARGMFEAFTEYKELVETPAFEEPMAQTSTAPAASPGQTPESRATGIAYYVQLMASQKPLETRGGRWDACMQLETKREDNYYKYLSGPFSDVDRARAEQGRLNTAGFNGTFVVAYQGDKRVSIQDAMASSQK